MTGVPSALIQRISGRGLPVAAQSTTVPVVLEKSIRLVGSFKKTGPDKPLPPFIPSAWLPPVNNNNNKKYNGQSISFFIQIRLGCEWIDHVITNVKAEVVTSNESLISSSITIVHLRAL